MAVGELAITPPSIKPLYDGKYVGAAELDNIASLTLKFVVRFSDKLLKNIGSQESLVIPFTLKEGIKIYFLRSPILKSSGK
ncbi:hypothetical protein A500_09028 [Clostridium sartagoforme AAU1]|uniref:Uncharacterized protein n=1 Tax=Clostridium sartagoforme AAU1 TaxID=1202534 RepID=R9C9S7_9CLOT|nr:hypothetical protein [Clostridium sartagoforme]EOR26119.1 hypothetical protein A500_09028 [Clostridium sartagoforme AAU1]